MKRLSWSMTTLLFPRNARAVRLGAALGLVFTARFLAAAEAAFPAIPDAPTVPMAPTLPDAAIIREPLQPAASQEIIEERPTSKSRTAASVAPAPSAFASAPASAGPPDGLSRTTSIVSPATTSGCRAVRTAPKTALCATIRASVPFAAGRAP